MRIYFGNLLTPALVLALASCEGLPPGTPPPADAPVVVSHQVVQADVLSEGAAAATFATELSMLPALAESSAPPAVALAPGADGRTRKLHARLVAEGVVAPPAAGKPAAFVLSGGSSEAEGEDALWTVTLKAPVGGTWSKTLKINPNRR